MTVLKKEKKSSCSEKMRPKKSSLVCGNWLGKIFLSPTHPHKPNVYENIYFLFQKKKHIHTNKKISTSKLLVLIFVFSLQTIKDRALCFSTKKSAVRVVFKCKLYLIFFLQLPG